MRSMAIAVAALGLGMSNGAHAAIATDTASSSLGEVFLAVWDVSGNATYLQDLGIPSRTTDWATYSSSFSIDTSTYNAVLGASDPANLRFGVYAGTSQLGGFQDIFFTAPAGFDLGSALIDDPFGDLGQNMANLIDLTNAHNAGSTNYALNVATSALSGPGAIGNNPGSVFNGNFLNNVSPFATFGAIGEALTFYRLGWDLDTVGDLNVRRTLQEWSFDGQTLTYSAIPLPAGVWLLGSALLGLVGVSRRRA